MKTTTMFLALAFLASAAAADVKPAAVDPAKDVPFGTIARGGEFTMTVMDTAGTGETLTGGEFTMTIGAVMPLEVPCPADFSGDGEVGVQDIYDFLGAFHAGDSAADFTGADGLTVQDIYDFLGAWYDGCK